MVLHLDLNKIKHNPPNEPIANDNAPATSFML